MNAPDGLISSRRFAPQGLMMILALLVLSPSSGRAGGSLCKGCVEVSNDTASSTGIVAISRLDVYPALDPHVAFIGVDQHLRCAMPAPPGWQIEVVDPVAIAGGCAMELDSLRNPMISYHDATGMLLLARRIGGSWVVEPVDPTAGVAGTTSIARVPGGVGITYADVGTGQLKYAERIGAEPWSVDVVAAAGGGDVYPSLVTDGIVRAISYYDRVQGDLRIAVRQTDSPWVTSFVDSGGNVGGYTSMVGRPSTGGVGIAYYDFSNADLKYALSVPGGWAIQTVDGVGGAVGRFCSAAALTGSAADLVGIGYYDQTNGNLEYALEQGPVWTRSLQDSADDVGAPVACGVSAGSSDTVGIAYVDRTTGDLRYLWHAGTLTAAPAPVAASAALHVQWLRLGYGAGGRVRFSVPAAGMVRVAIYDAGGRQVAVPLRQSLPAGPAEVRWDGRDRQGHAVQAGMFYVRVETSAGSGATPALVLR